MKNNKWNIFFNALWMLVGVTAIIRYYPKLNYLKMTIGLIIVLSSVYRIYNYILDKSDGNN